MYLIPYKQDKHKLKTKLQKHKSPITDERKKTKIELIQNMFDTRRLLFMFVSNKKIINSSFLINTLHASFIPNII